MKSKLHLTTILGVTAIATLHAEEQAKPAIQAVDSCGSVYKHVSARVAGDPGRIVEIVSNEVATNQSCSCEVVKAAIDQSKPDAETVAAIVEAVILAAPEHLRIIAQCAIAVASDAIVDVQAVLARLDPNSGENAAHGNKSPKAAIGEVAQMPNPLDFPGQGPVGPTPGGPGGLPLIPPLFPFVINPPVVTNVNP